MPQMKPPFLIGLFTALIAFVADQASKTIIVANGPVLSSSLAVAPGLNLIYLRNDGITFGLLGGAPWWSLVVVALSVCIWLTVMLLRTTCRVEAAAYGTIIGGALGNVIDRLRYGAVTDFLDFYVGPAHWPAFNMADVFVVGGVGLLLLAPWVGGRRRTSP